MILCSVPSFASTHSFPCVSMSVVMHPVVSGDIRLNCQIDVPLLARRTQVNSFTDDAMGMKYEVPDAAIAKG